MTDKQIIIDRVDVAGCVRLKDDEISCDLGGECKGWENCYYKQLKHKEQELKNICKTFDIEYIIDKETGNLIGRCNKLYKKEQECEALQMSENEAGEIIAELKAYKDINEDFKTAWEELKAENEDLKKIINEAKSSRLDLKSFLVGEAVQKEYEQQVDQLKVDREESLKQLEFVRTLNTVKEAEIRKLKQTLTKIKEIAECCQTPANCKDYCQFYNECIDSGLPLILQKISECEVEE